MDGDAYSLTFTVQAPSSLDSGESYLKGFYLKREAASEFKANSILEQLLKKPQYKNTSVRLQLNDLTNLSQNTQYLKGQVADLRSFVTKRVETVKMMIFSSEIMRNLMMDLLDLA